MKGVKEAQELLQECQSILVDGYKMHEEKVQAIIRDTSYWMEMVWADEIEIYPAVIPIYNGQLWNINVNIWNTYVTLCTAIPCDITKIWCITPKNGNGIQGLFRDVVENTSMVSYLVGDQIFQIWQIRDSADSSDIKLFLGLLHALQDSYHATHEIAKAVQEYYYTRIVARMPT